MNKYYERLRIWVGLLLGAGIALKFFIFPEVSFFFHIPIFIYIVIGGIVTGFVVRKGIINGAGAGFLAGIIVQIVGITYLRFSSNTIELFWYRLSYFDIYNYFDILSIIQMVIGGAIGGGFHQFLESKINKRIIQRIKSELWHIENYRFKEKLNFIKKYTVFLAFLTIILGIVIILSENYSSTNRNAMQINSEEAFQLNNESNNEVPFFVNISMVFNYEEPAIRQVNLNFFNICIDFIKNPQYNGSANSSIDSIDLTVSTPSNSPDNLEYPISIFPIVQFKKSLAYDPAYFRGGCHPYEFSSIIPINPYLNPNLIQEYRNNSFPLDYNLRVDGGDFWMNKNGRANLIFPIRVLDSVEEMNMRFNKTILSLTGVLIILGSFPFFAALNQLLGNDKEK